MFEEIEGKVKESFMKLIVFDSSKVKNLEYDIKQLTTHLSMQDETVVLQIDQHASEIIE